MAKQEDYDAVLVGLASYIKIETPLFGWGISEAEATDEISIANEEGKSMGIDFLNGI